MQDFYDSMIIPIILKTFKIKKGIISGIKDNKLIKIILSHDATFIQINTNKHNCIKGNPLNILPNLENYDAIFINDDSNWYTVFNELEIIKKTNDNFPLVFICNNNFPNKRRDSYSNPNNIPTTFRHKYTKELPICYNNEKIIISDGFYHACEENTSKNGVLTAIEDFLKENSYVEMIKINFTKDICILCPKSQINQKRISIITKNIQDNKIDDINLSDKLIENQLLISYINRYKLYNEELNEFEVEISRKNTIINDYETKIRNQNNEMKFKETQINGFETDLSLKDSQIKNIESKLVNRDKKINNLESELKKANSNLHSLTQEIDDKSDSINNLEREVELLNKNLTSLTQNANKKDKEINKLTDNLIQKESQYNSQINSLNNQLKQKDQNLKNTKDNYSKQIKVKEDEINFLKNDLTIKEKSITTREVELKNKINNTKQNILQKDNQILVQQKELDNKKLKIDILKHAYTQQLSKIDNNEYCIHCFKEEISNNHLEINYLENNNITKTILRPFAYLYLILKSKPKEISLNIKLYKAIKDSNCFDIGFYLNNNKDLIKSKWCKYFSPELHYIINGFDENRTFNKKYFNRKSKKDLLEYILTCTK